MSGFVARPIRVILTFRIVILVLIFFSVFNAYLQIQADHCHPQTVPKVSRFFNSFSMLSMLSGDILIRINEKSSIPIMSRGALLTNVGVRMAKGTGLKLNQSDAFG